MKAHRIDTAMFAIILITSLLFIFGSKSYAADPYGVSPPSGRRWVVTFEDDFTKDREIDKKRSYLDASILQMFHLSHRAQPYNESRK